MIERYATPVTAAGRSRSGHRASAKTSIVALHSMTVGGIGVLVAVAGLLAMAMPAGADAQSLPEIRTSAKNRVPACVTPARLTRFLEDGNPRLPSRLRTIAVHYKFHGERLRVRWDYAFFQMIIETSYLKFKNNAGKGDVDPRQNNFAGIGTTGGGVPGNSFPDVTTGVLAQMQHLVAYSGETVANPVARRTGEKQDEIAARSRRLNRAVTFRDLAGRWAADRSYGRSIAFIADLYTRKYCSGRFIAEAPAEDVPPVTSARDRDRDRDRGHAVVLADNALAEPALDVARLSLDAAAAATGPPAGLAGPPAPAIRPRGCRVFTASYGGEKNILIRRFVGEETQYTALQVLEGREAGLAQSFIRKHARGGQALAEFPNRSTALARAFAFCPDAAGPKG